MKLHKLLLLASVCLTIASFAACQNEPTVSDGGSTPVNKEEITSTPLPTNTPAPMATSTPTPTPEPTATPTPTPTNTPTPTPNPANDYDYEFNEYQGGIIIMAYTGEQKELSIPAEIDGSPVVAISKNAFAKNTTLESIVLPDSLKTIGDQAFAYCTSLTSISLSDSLTDIGDYAFGACTGLTEFVLPANVRRIGTAILHGCNSLQTLIVDPNNTFYTSRDGNSKECNIIMNDIYVQQGCNSSVIPTENVYSIEQQAFAGYTNLTALTIPDNIVEIRIGAFSNCGINSIILPDNMLEIEDNAFINCTNLTSLTLPHNLDSYSTNIVSNASPELIINTSNPQIASTFQDAGFNINLTDAPEIIISTPIPTSAPEEVTHAYTIQMLENISSNVWSVFSGIIITKVDNMYGAMDYNGNILVPNSYPRYIAWEPDSELFALGDYTQTVVYDKNGTPVFSKEHIGSLELLGNIVAYTQGGSYEELHLYNIDTKEEIVRSYVDAELSGENYHLFTQWISAIQKTSDGKFLLLCDGGADVAYNLIVSPETGERLTNHLLLGDISPSHDNYAAVMSYQTDSPNRYYGLINLLTGERYELLAEPGWNTDEACSLRHFLNLQDIDSQVYGELRSYFDDYNNSYNNLDMQVIASIECTGTSSNPYIKDILLDFSKATVNKESVCTNLDDIVIAEHDYIGLSESGYYLASDNDDWFYIDHTGKKVADYKDCSAFYRGYALVIDDDNLAYLIDSNFKKVSEGYPATSVHRTVGSLVIVNGDQQTYFVIEEE